MEKQETENLLTQYKHDIDDAENKIQQLENEILKLKIFVNKSFETNSTEYHVARLKILSLNCDLGNEKSNKEDLEENRDKLIKKLNKINVKLNKNIKI